MAITESLGKIETTVRCRNCGCPCTSNFCPDCGQSVSERRLENKTFFMGLALSLLRINRCFVSTAWHLLVHPWKVIRDYIQCRRIRYTAPVAMLILVCFLNTVVGAMISSESQPAVSEVNTSGIPLVYKAMFYIGYFLMNNTIAKNLTIYIPALLAIPVVYGREGAGKYNLAEYFTAMIYMTTSFLVFGLVTSPLMLVSESWYSGLGIGYSVLISCISLYKAFPHASARKRIGLFILYLLVAGLAYLLLLTLIALIVGMGANNIQ